MGDTAAQIAALLSGKLPFMQGTDFNPDISRTLDSKKVSDHHAIIPTMELAKTDLAALPESERNILILAGARLLSAAAEPHVYEAVTAVFSCADTEFTAKGKTVTRAGWKELERRYRATLKGKAITSPILTVALLGLLVRVQQINYCQMNICTTMWISKRPTKEVFKKPSMN